MEDEEELLISSEILNDMTPPPPQLTNSLSVTTNIDFSTQPPPTTTLDASMKDTRDNGRVQCIDEPVNCYIFRRPHVSILNEYKMNKKAGRNHFNRYSDVIVNDRERKASTSCDKLLSQKSSLESSSGWRLYYLSSQFDDLAQLEKDLRESLVLCKNEIPSPKINGEYLDGFSDVGLNSEDSQLRLLHELLQGNLQRCQLSIEQLQEAKQSMFTLLEHRQKYTEIQKQRSELTKVKEKGVS